MEDLNALFMLLGVDLALVMTLIPVAIALVSFLKGRLNLPDLVILGMSLKGTSLLSFAVSMLLGGYAAGTKAAEGGLTGSEWVAIVASGLALWLLAAGAWDTVNDFLKRYGTPTKADSAPDPDKLE